MVNDLSQLHDIHLPESIGRWPLAPGWYVLATILIATGLLMGLLCYRHYSYGRAKRAALKELAIYQKQYQHDANSQLCTANISELLKRVALAYYPRTRVAGLQGEAWLIFLNSTAKGVNFNSVRMQLLELPWHPSQAHTLQPLFNIAKKWIMRQKKPCSN